MPSGKDRSENRQREPRVSRKEHDDNSLPPGYVRASDLLEIQACPILAPLMQSNPFAHLEQGNPAYRALPGRDGRSYSDPVERPNIDREMTRIMVRERRQAEEAKDTMLVRGTRTETSQHYHNQHDTVRQQAHLGIDKETAKRWYEQHQAYLRATRPRHLHQPVQGLALTPLTSPLTRFHPAQPGLGRTENENRWSTRTNLIEHGPRQQTYLEQHRYSVSARFPAGMDQRHKQGAAR